MKLKAKIYIYGLTKCTVYYKKTFLLFSLFFSMLFLCSFFRLKELFKVKNGLTTSRYFFFFKFQKFQWVGRTTINGEKKEDGFRLCHKE